MKERNQDNQTMDETKDNLDHILEIVKYQTVPLLNNRNLYSYKTLSNYFDTISNEIPIQIDAENQETQALLAARDKVAQALGTEFIDKYADMVSRGAALDPNALARLKIVANEITDIDERNIALKKIQIAELQSELNILIFEKSQKEA